MSRVSTKEAAELVALLGTTPVADRAERWPSLLTLLARWALSHKDGAATVAPARPWERRQQQQAGKANRAVAQDLLHRAVTLVQQALQDAAVQAQEDPCGPAAAALSDLLVPALSFLTAALTAISGPDAHDYQHLVVATTCEAAAAIAAASPGLLSASTAQQQGLLAVLASCKALLLTCKGNAEQSGWLVSCLLAALHSAIPNVLSHTLQQQQRQQQHHTDTVQAATPQESSRRAAMVSPPRRQDGLLDPRLWLQQQAQSCAATTTQALLSGLYSLGRDFGLNCCHTTAAAPSQQPGALSAAQGGAAARVAGSYAGSSSIKVLQQQADSGMQVLQAVASVLQAACREASDELLQGLAASVAAGLCAGVLEGLPPAAVQAAGGQPAVSHTDAAFDAAADAAWQGSQLVQHHTTDASLPRADIQQHLQQHSTQQPHLQHSRHALQQQQQQQAAQWGAGQQFSTGRQQLLDQARELALALQAACSRYSAQPGQAARAARPAAAAVGCGLLGQAYGRLMSSCAHLLPLLDATAAQQHQHQQQVCPPSLPGLLCALHYLTNHCCSLSGLFYFAAGCHNVAAANSWLSGQQQQHPAQEVGMLARWLATAAAALPREQLLQLLRALRESGVQLARSYSCYLSMTPAAVADGVDGTAVRQQLDRSFATHVAVLAEAWRACSHKLLSQQNRSSVAGAGGEGVAAATACNGDLQAGVVAVSLADLAALQFCRLQLPAYIDLLKGLVSALATSHNGQAADAFLEGALPCYDRLTQGMWMLPSAAAATTAAAAAAAGMSTGKDGYQVGAAGSSTSGDAGSVALWLQDKVTAAELSFLLPLLPVAVRASGNAAAAAGRVLPLVLLLLPHPVPGVAQAAHGAFAGLLAIGAEQQQSGQEQQPAATSPASSSEAQEQHIEQQQQQQQQQAELLQVVQQSVPMYLQRSLSALPAYGSVDGLSASYYSLLKNLPVGSVMGLLAVNALADKALQLATAAEEPQHDSSAGSGGPQQTVVVAGHTGQHPSVGTAAAGGRGGGEGVAVSAGVAAAEPLAVAKQLVDLLVLSLQLGDYQLLPAMLDTVRSCVLAAPHSVQQQWLSQLYAGCLSTGDYTRKPALVSWFDQLQKEARQQLQGQWHGMSARPPSTHGCAEGQAGAEEQL